MSETRFIVGDVVKLKSNGPQMTVERVLKKNSVSIAACVWFEGPMGVIAYRSDFPVGTLKKVGSK